MMANVPRIDISSLFGDDTEAKKKTAAQIELACKGSGFFLAAGHGISELLGEMVDVTRNFHRNITDEEKQKLAIVAYNKENTKQIRNGYYLPIPGKKAVESYCYLNPSFTIDHEMIKDNIPMHEVNVWPDEQKYVGFREFQEQFYWKLFEVSSALLKGFAILLGKNETFFNEYFTKEDTLSSVRLIRYPYMEDYPPVKTALDGTKISFDSHVDVSLLTVLYQPHVDNLQVETEFGYQNIPSSDDCFLVNVGGYMEHITNGFLKAPVHRVKWINKERLSLPFFVNLGFNSAIPPFTPIPHINANTLQNTTLSFGEYFERERQTLVEKNGQT